MYQIAQASQERGWRNKAFQSSSLKPLRWFTLTKKKGEKRDKAAPSPRLAQGLEEGGNGAIPFYFLLSPESRDGSTGLQGKMLNEKAEMGLKWKVSVFWLVGCFFFRF